ncbi:hypothetical protein B0H34DRAFT_794317 [Crassisporium funariophilum]|nr:hypothetical protein B0H34DRAFT_794317 [Crassisporium funariophilum]
MSDSFADLWNTTTPLPPKPPSNTLSSASTTTSSSAASSSTLPIGLQRTGTAASSSPTYGYARKPDVFALLATPSTGGSVGKETNICALLSSLDQVLWPEVVGVKMGLHKLIMPAHVKKGYVRAIGRVHPDKLNASNSTVEQRMLANAVFGTLNEAWIAFQNGK